jgi:hypothetical protein
LKYRKNNSSEKMNYRCLTGEFDTSASRLPAPVYQPDVNIPEGRSSVGRHQGRLQLSTAVCDEGREPVPVIWLNAEDR